MAEQRHDDTVDGDGGADDGGEGPGPSLLHPTDTWLAALILAVCAVLYYITSTFEEVAQLFAQDIPPEFFPRLLLWTIVALTVLMPFENRFLARQRKSIDRDREKRIKPISFLTAAVLFVIVAATTWLGTTLSMVAVCVVLPMLWGERRLKVVVPFAIIFPALVTLLFSSVLGVHFEPGILGAWVG